MNNRIPPPLVGIVVLAIAWLVARHVPALGFDLPARQWIAGIIGLSGLLIDLTAAGAFAKIGTTVNPLSPEKTEKLVVSGLYRFTRNPMYLGMALMALAWGLWQENFGSVACVALFVAYITQFQIKPEEAALAEKFGDQFREYRARVRRWI
ncbi:methyltransferase family protein [Aurantiacibacter sp. D1-12]|uniref:methyltransferase family protein n=1 Tax=Aurantiacibacter sp. D1-12 TaxID=2993658 RepID=UPI00237CDD23|nr:isoprenylcysteine carboxylmethyltransferase family protein [Aurantiacibacter sp. D1-12]MDE1466805.1 isoprenylcysteine carboxylmethyltransferase family protein [Aurantiacibacter sp. D1-12]